MIALLIAACLLFILISATLWRRQIALRRKACIRNFTLPQGLFDKLCKKHPHLTLKECQLVAHGLRQFFLAHLKSRRQYVSMPSQVVEVAADTQYGLLPLAGTFAPVLGAYHAYFMGSRALIYLQIGG